MPTEKQLEANRLNAQKSTGPVSAEGKAAVRMNALKTGIFARSQIIRGENPDKFEVLVEEFVAEHHPTTATERSLVDTIAHSEWMLRRLRKAEAQLWEVGFEQEEAVASIDHAPLGFVFGRVHSLGRVQRNRNSARRAIN